MNWPSNNRACKNYKVIGEILFSHLIRTWMPNLTRQNGNTESNNEFILLFCYRAVVLYNSLTTAREQVVSLHISDPAAMVVCHSSMYLSLQIHILTSHPTFLQTKKKEGKGKKINQECLVRLHCLTFPWYQFVPRDGWRLDNKQSETIIIPPN